MIMPINNGKLLARPESNLCCLRAHKLKSKGKKSLLVACDVYRPAAIEQLKINGEKQGVEVFSMGAKNKAP